jgi:hypothetical protein
MAANAKTLAHSQVIITELIATLVRQVELPLEIAKLEGDAIFLYCRKNRASAGWIDARRGIAAKLLGFFKLFGQKVAELRQSTTCTCSACSHIDRLRLKLVVHSGEALFHSVVHFTELAGVDVIIVHRLLKNSVRRDEYLLTSEPAFADLEFPPELQWTAGAETYDDIGRVATLLHVPGANSAAESVVPDRAFGNRFRTSWWLWCRMWFRSLAPLPGAGPTACERLQRPVHRGARFSFALLTLVLSPIYLPVGTLRVLWSAWQRRYTRRLK